VIVELTTLLSTIATGVLFVNVCGAEPAHGPGLTGTLGVTVTVATNGVVPGFCAVNEGMFPVPAAARPIAGVLFVQLNTAPAEGLVKFTGAVGEPAQTV